MAQVICFAVFTCAGAFASGFETLSLAGSGWVVTNRNGSVSISASVPSTAHSALLAAGVLNEPLEYRFNERNYRWVAEESWTFSKLFTVESANFLSGTQMVALEFDSIDTYATVTLNGHVLGAAPTYSPDPVTDEHTHFPFHVNDGPYGNHTQRLLPGTNANLLEVRIETPLAIGRAAANDYNYTVPLTHFCNAWDDNEGTCNFSGNTTSSRNFVRKASSDFGWDWGPAFVPQGLLGDVKLVTFDTAHLHPTFTVVQAHGIDGSVRLHVRAELYAPVSSTRGGTINMVVNNAAGRQVASVMAPISSLSAGDNPVSLTVTLRAQDVELWWPAGYGEQPLYDVAVNFIDYQRNMQTAKARVGLRTVRLVTAPAPKNQFGKVGEYFYFVVNGVEVYAKGANWIPSDVLPDRVTHDDVHWLLSSAKDANMNMVRVWGGGKFQSDDFYNTCDELGLMVWQEMMFACALYPTNDAFLASVSAEIASQVARLQSHASIVIWGGNNENEGALTWYAESQRNRSFYQADYTKLYLETVLPALRKADPSLVFGTTGGRVFVDSSPSNGLINASDPLTKRWGSVGDWEYGDVHYYNYNADCEDYTTYPEARFVSEHGFQSWPAYVVVEGVTSERDRSRKSTWFDFRQRHQQGNNQLINMMARHFTVPAATADSSVKQRQVFDDFLFLTQVQQARCYETAISQWRRLKGVPSVKTMGVLYWQLNDIWQGPSWSSMEYDGRWRVVHYVVQRAYAPLLLSAFLDRKSSTPTVRVHLTSDLTSNVSAGEIVVELRSWSAAVGDAPLQTWSHRIGALASLGSAEVFNASSTELLQSHKASNVFVRFVLTGTTSTRRVTAEAFWWPTTLGNASLPAANVTVSSVRLLSSTMAEINVHTDRTSVFTLLETNGALVGKFSANALTLLPGAAQTVTFTSRKPFMVDELRAALQVRSLVDALSNASTHRGRR